MKTWVKVTIAVLLTFIFTSVAFTFLFFSFIPQSRADTLGLVKDIIDEHYIGEYNDEDFSRYAVYGALSSINDKYASYATREEAQDIFSEFSGEYVGLGIEIYNGETGYITILGVYEDSPAQKAGILPGDLIVRVDDSEYTGEEMTQAVRHMKGKNIPNPVGTTVDITVKRGEEELLFTVTRDVIAMYPVTYQMYGDILYIKYTGFDATSCEKLSNIINDNKASGIILDLQNNPGGDLQAAIDLCDIFLEKGTTIMYTEDNKNERIEYKATKDAIDTPLIVLTNGASASASEITVGALKCNNRATIVGSKTYGKGVTQGVYPILNGTRLEGAITLTSYKNLLPSLECIDKTGINPDVETTEEDALKTALKILNGEKY